MTHVHHQHHQRDLETALGSFILAVVSWFSRTSIISHAESVERGYEPGASTFKFVAISACISVVRFGMLPRIRVVTRIHEFVSVIVPQVGIALLGLYYLSCGFPNSWIVKALTRNDSHMFGISRTLFIVCGIMNVLHIRHVDFIIPLMAHAPILVICLTHVTQPDILMPALLATALLWCSSILIHGRQTPGQHFFLGIPTTAWFYFGMACAMFLHHVALVNLLLDSPKPFMTFVSMLVKLAPT